jgi:putative hydrolase of the HAD superfamily
MRMASHLLGTTKPDPAIYRMALDRMGVVEPQRVLFIDDRAENVEAALAFGIRAFQSLSPADTVAGLRRFGVSW